MLEEEGVEDHDERNEESGDAMDQEDEDDEDDTKSRDGEEEVSPHEYEAQDDNFQEDDGPQEEREGKKGDEADELLRILEQRRLTDAYLAFDTKQRSAVTKIRRAHLIFVCITRMGGEAKDYDKLSNSQIHAKIDSFVSLRIASEDMH